MTTHPAFASPEKPLASTLHAAVARCSSGSSREAACRLAAACGSILPLRKLPLALGAPAAQIRAIPGFPENLESKQLGQLYELMYRVPVCAMGAVERQLWNVANAVMLLD